MADLTDEQVERACKAFQDTLGCNMEKCLRSAAPFLQFPWDEPSETEAGVVFDRYYGQNIGYQREQFRTALIEFVQYRNANLMPKPVDPRIAIVRHQLGGASMVHDLDGVAVKILHALDAAK